MNAVEITILDNGYRIKLTLNGKEYKQDHISTAYGCQQVSGPSWDDIDDIPDKLWAELSSASMACFGIVENLPKANTES